MNLLRKSTWGALLVVPMMLSCSNKKGTAPAPGAAGDPNPVKDYPVLTVSERSATLFSDYPANIQGQQNIEIRPKIDGYIERIFVDEGATVKKGQPLFRISAPQFEQEVRTAEANIKIAQADVGSARMEVERVRPLVERNIISKYELESAQLNMQAKQAALAQARATLANARTNLGYTNITSPANGVVGSIPHKIGSLVSSNTAEPLTTVANVGNIYAYFSVNEKQALQFSKSAKGTTIEERLKLVPPVSLILPDGTEFSQKGRLETGSGLINTETGSISVRATFPNPGNLIRSGSSGVVRIPRTVDSAILIPQKATFEIQGKKFVYVVERTGTVRSAEIEVMESNEGQFFVVQKGLNAGDKIVLEGVASLKDGAAIKPKTANADSLYQQLLK